MTIHALENKKKGKGKHTLQVACLFACFAVCWLILDSHRRELLVFSVFL
jgi:hypothetical protein